MERKLSVYIITERGNLAEIIVSDDETGCDATFYVGGYCTTDEEAMKIGYEIISWAEVELEKEMML